MILCVLCGEKKKNLTTEFTEGRRGLYRDKTERNGIPCLYIRFDMHSTIFIFFTTEGHREDTEEHREDTEGHGGYTVLIARHGMA